MMSVKEAFSLMLGLVFMGALLPTGIFALVNASTTGWDSTTIILWGLLPLIVIGVIIMKYTGGLGGGR